MKNPALKVECSDGVKIISAYCVDCGEKFADSVTSDFRTFIRRSRCDEHQEIHRKKMASERQKKSYERKKQLLEAAKKLLEECKNGN